MNLFYENNPVLLKTFIIIISAFILAWIVRKHNTRVALADKTRSDKNGN
jgi:hypothetical protein